MCRWMMSGVEPCLRAPAMVIKLSVGPMECNCYIVSCDASREAVVVDPGADPQKIRQALRKHSLTPKWTVNTHGHADHIGANGALGLPVLIHALDAEYLTDPAKNLSAMFFFSVVSPKAARFVSDGDAIEFGRSSMTVIHTPGHTPGSISLRMGGFLFSGDTLFCGGVGRTDLPHGDEALLMKSIREKILPLSDCTLVYPGHGPDTTVGEERRSNPFL